MPPSGVLPCAARRLLGDERLLRPPRRCGRSAHKFDDPLFGQAAAGLRDDVVGRLRGAFECRGDGLARRVKGAKGVLCSP